MRKNKFIHIAANKYPFNRTFLFRTRGYIFKLYDPVKGILIFSNSEKGMLNCKSRNDDLLIL